MSKLSPTLIKELVDVGRKQVETWAEYFQPRLDEIKKSEDQYYAKVKPALKGRFNIPLPVMEGFVETLMSKIDDSIKVTFKKGREATLQAAKMVTSAWNKDSAPSRGNYNGADLDSKKLAIFSGYGVTQLIPFKNPYKQELIAIDYHDFVFEPLGGRDINKHQFRGKINVFKTIDELLEGANSGMYDRTGVNVLQTKAPSTQDSKRLSDAHKNKVNRFSAMGLDPAQYGYTGSKNYNLTELELLHKGKFYYLLFDYTSGAAVRAELLKDIYSHGLSSFTAWHTERNPVNFACRAPADSVRPVAEFMRIFINQNADNVQKRNWDQIMYNIKNIVNPAELEYRPHGLVRVKLKEGERMDNAYAKLTTPDTTSITLDMVMFLNNFLGEKVGVSPATQGKAEEQRVGIYFGNLQQIADRLGLMNKFYSQAHVETAKKYHHNLRDYVPRKGFMVNFIGVKGVREKELTRDVIDPDLEVTVISENVEAAQDELLTKKKETAILRMIKTPTLSDQASPRWLFEENLRIGGYDEAAIKIAGDKNETGDAENRAEAMQSVEAFLGGETPPINKSATQAFLQVILDYAIEERENIGDEIFDKLIAYIEAHEEVVIENAARAIMAEEMMLQQEARRQMITGGMPGGVQGAPPQIPTESAETLPNTPNR